MKKRDFLQQLERFIEKSIKGGFRLDYDPDHPLSYIAAFLRDRSVASVAPSTKYVVDRVLRAMDLATASAVVEYGPAEGVITRKALARMPAGGAFIAVERNADFVKALKKIDDPRLRVIHGDVQHIDEVLGPVQVDVIVSGIPFSFLEPAEREKLLQKTHDRLRPGGRFVAYQFTAHLIPLLKRRFRKVKTEFEIRNLPPHFVFTAYK